MYEFPVERGKIREFARAAHSTNPAHDGPDAMVPPTFLVTAAGLWEPPEELRFDELPIDRARMLHGEEEHIFHGPPPRAGSVLRVTAELGPVTEKTGSRGGVMRVHPVLRKYRDDTGRLVAEQRTYLLVTGKNPQEAG